MHPLFISLNTVYTLSPLVSSINYLFWRRNFKVQINENKHFHFVGGKHRRCLLFAAFYGILNIYWDCTFITRKSQKIFYELWMNQHYRAKIKFICPHTVALIKNLRDSKIHLKKVMGIQTHWNIYYYSKFTK